MRVFAGLIIACFAAPALAQMGAGLSIPDYDVDTVCATNGDSRGRAVCLRLEQSSYDTLRYLWPQASEVAKRYAIKGAADAIKSRAYYQILTEYLEIAIRNERDARDEPNPRRFQR